METQSQFADTEKGLVVRAPAKINISLLIAGKRPDGYHEIETVMAKINLYDEILIEPGVRPGIELRCQGPHWAPDGPDNLVYRAAALMLDACRAKADLRITLTKNIPAGSGLGSASSDAAATLMGVARLLRRHVTSEGLGRLAGQLGSDVAFFLDGPLAFCTGRGEKVMPIKASYGFLALLILPGLHVGTDKVYAHYAHDSDLYCRHHEQIDSLLSQKRMDLIAAMQTNMLAETCFGLETGLATLKDRIEAIGIGPLCLTGSGSTLVKIMDRADANQAQRDQALIAARINCQSLIVTDNPW